MTNDRDARADARQSRPPVSFDQFPIGAPCAVHTYKLRRLRDQVLGRALFGEPAWDTLLLLTVAHESEGGMTLARLMTELRLSEDGARQVMTDLERAGLVEPDDYADPATEVALTAEGYCKLTVVLS